MSNSKKSLDSEVNLIAFISLLSVLICALLLTAIWVQVGSINVKQAVGGSSDSKQTNPSLWVSLHSDGRLDLRLQDAPRKLGKLRNLSIVSIEGGDG